MLRARTLLSKIGACFSWHEKNFLSSDLAAGRSFSGWSGWLGWCSGGFRKVFCGDESLGGGLGGFTVHLCCLVVAEVLVYPCS